MRIPARTAMVMHARACAHLHGHGHARTFKGTRTAMFIPLRVMRTATLSTRPASGLSRSSANPVHSNTLKLRNASTNLQSNQYSKHLGGMGVSVDDGVDDDDDRGGGIARVFVRPEGRTGSRARWPDR